MVFLFYSQHQPRVRLYSGTSSLSPRSVRLPLCLLFLILAILSALRLSAASHLSIRGKRNGQELPLGIKNRQSWIPEHHRFIAKGPSWCLNPWPEITWERQTHPGSFRSYSLMSWRPLSSKFSPAVRMQYIVVPFLPKTQWKPFAISLLAFFKCVFSRPTPSVSTYNCVNKPQKNFSQKGSTWGKDVSDFAFYST